MKEYKISELIKNFRITWSAICIQISIMSLLN